MCSAGAGLRLARLAGHGTLHKRCCDCSESGSHEAIYDCPGAKIPKRIVDYEVYNHYAILSAQAKNSLVSNSKETTRSHPEHGRKDLLQ